MRIPAQATIATVEQVLNDLVGAGPEEALKIPLNLRHLAGGGEAALSQLIVTWAQARPRALLNTYLETPEQVEDFVRRLAGLTGTLCATEIRGGRENAVITEQVQAAALSRLDVLLSAKPKAAYRGSSVEIVCADHLGRDAPYLLYQPGGSRAARLRSRDSFSDLASWLLRQSVPNAYQPLIDPETPHALGGMMFELFKNTEDHGQVDALGNVLALSIRAIKTLHHALQPERLAQIVADYPPLARYCESLLPPHDAAQTHLFELSVLDSGPGFAVSRTGKPLPEISPDEEEAAVRDCFTTFSAKGGSRFGQGLPHVLRLLRKEGGFLRLRTGRISLHADFSSNGTREGPEALEVYRPAGARHLAPVAGSLLTVLLPLRRDR